MWHPCNNFACPEWVQGQCFGGGCSSNPPPEEKPDDDESGEEDR